MSASYSRARDSASCISALSVGAKISRSRRPSEIGGRAPISTAGSANSSMIWPNQENRLTMREIQSARPITQASLLATWVISWASTPRTSRGVSERSRPSLMPIAPSSGVPTANALIMREGT